MPSAFLDAFRNGDAGLFHSLRVRYSGLVRAQFWKRRVLRPDVDDLEQELWLLVWTCRSTFRGGAASEFQSDTTAAYVDRVFRTWLIRLCQSVGNRSQRTRKRDVLASAAVEGFAENRLISDQAELTSAHTPEIDEQIIEAGVERDHADLLWDVVMNLPPRRRAVLLQRLIAGCSTRETAELLGCSPNTVKVTLKQALAAVREEYRRLRR
jgi:RNA polymerase sigma factor (sigma-70 family)